MERKTNWLAVVVAVVAAMLIGFLWYGLLFVDPWMAGNGFTMEGEKLLRNGAEVIMPMNPMIFNVLSTIVSILLLNWLVGRTGASTFMAGAQVGAAVGLIMAIGIFTGNMFAARPMSLSMVDGSYNFVILLVIGGILGGWQKR